MYSQLILKRASAEGLAELARMTAAEYVLDVRNSKVGPRDMYILEAAQCANELIRREIDRYCAWLAWITCDPTSGALEGTAAVVQDANTIIALRTWESQLQ